MTHRNSNLHRNGYMKVTTMANMGKVTEIPENKRTPFNLTTNELLKKLCNKGPDGCNETCENWDKCLYGQAWKERIPLFKVRAAITLKNRDKIVRYFYNMPDAIAWADRHMGHYKRFDAEEIKEEETDKDSVEVCNG